MAANRFGIDLPTVSMNENINSRQDISSISDSNNSAGSPTISLGGNFIISTGGSSTSGDNHNKQTISILAPDVYQSYVANNIFSTQQIVSNPSEYLLNQNTQIYDYTEVNNPIIAKHGLKLIYQDIDGTEFNGFYEASNGIKFGLRLVNTDEYENVEYIPIDSTTYDIFKLYKNLTPITYYVYAFDDKINNEITYKQYFGNIDIVDDIPYGNKVPYYHNLVPTTSIDTDNIDILAYNTAVYDYDKKRTIVLKTYEIPSCKILNSSDNSDKLYGYFDDKSLYKVSQNFTLNNVTLNNDGLLCKDINDLIDLIKNYSLYSPQQIIKTGLKDSKTGKNDIISIDGFTLFTPVGIKTINEENNYEYIPYTLSRDNNDDNDSNTLPGICEVNIKLKNDTYQPIEFTTKEYNQTIYLNTEDKILYKKIIEDNSEEIYTQLSSITINNIEYYRLSDNSNNSFEIYFTINSITQDIDFNYVEYSEITDDALKDYSKLIINLLTVSGSGELFFDKIFLTKKSNTEYSGKGNIFNDEHIVVNPVYEYEVNLTYLDYLQAMSTTYNIEYVDGLDNVSAYSFDPIVSSIEYKRERLFTRDGMNMNYVYYSPKEQSYVNYDKRVLYYNNTFFGSNLFDKLEYENADIEVVDLFERTVINESDKDNIYKNNNLLSYNYENIVATYSTIPFVVTNDYDYIFDNYHYTEPITSYVLQTVISDKVNVSFKSPKNLVTYFGLFKFGNWESISNFLIEPIVKSCYLYEYGLKEDNYKDKTYIRIEPRNINNLDNATITGSQFKSSFPIKDNDINSIFASLSLETEKESDSDIPTEIKITYYKDLFTNIGFNETDSTDNDYKYLNIDIDEASIRTNSLTPTTTNTNPLDLFTCIINNVSGKIRIKNTKNKKLLLVDLNLIVHNSGSNVITFGSLSTEFSKWKNNKNNGTIYALPLHNINNGVDNGLLEESYFMKPLKDKLRENGIDPNNYIYNVTYFSYSYDLVTDFSKQNKFTYYVSVDEEIKPNSYNYFCKLTYKYDYNFIGKGYTYNAYQVINVDGYWEKQYKKQIKPLINVSYTYSSNSIDISNAYIVPTVKNEHIGFIHNHKISYYDFVEELNEKYVYVYYDDYNKQVQFIENSLNKIINCGGNKYIGLTTKISYETKYGLIRDNNNLTIKITYLSYTHQDVASKYSSYNNLPKTNIFYRHKLTTKDNENDERTNKWNSDSNDSNIIIHNSVDITEINNITTFYMSSVMSNNSCKIIYENTEKIVSTRYDQSFLSKINRLHTIQNINGKLYICKFFSNLEYDFLSNNKNIDNLENILKYFYINMNYYGLSKQTLKTLTNTYSGEFTNDDINKYGNINICSTKLRTSNNEQKIISWYIYPNSFTDNKYRLVDEPDKIYSNEIVDCLSGTNKVESTSIRDIFRRLNVIGEQKLKEYIIQEDEYVPQIAQIDTPFGLVNGKKVVITDQIYIPETYETIISVDPNTNQYVSNRVLATDAYMAYTYEVEDIPFITATYIFNNDEGIKIQGLDLLIERLTGQPVSDDNGNYLAPSTTLDPNRIIQTYNSNSSLLTKAFNKSFDTYLSYIKTSLVYINESIDRNTKNISYSIDNSNVSNDLKTISSNILTSSKSQISADVLNTSNLISAQKNMMSKISDSINNQTTTISKMMMLSMLGNSSYSYGSASTFSNILSSMISTTPKNWQSVTHIGYQTSEMVDVESWKSVSYKHTKVISKTQRPSNLKELITTHKFDNPAYVSFSYVNAFEDTSSVTERIGLHLKKESRDFTYNGNVYHEDYYTYQNIADILADLHVSTRIPSRKEFLVDVSKRLYVNSDFMFAYTSDNEWALRAIRRADILWTELVNANIVESEESTYRPLPEIPTKKKYWYHDNLKLSYFAYAFNLDLLKLQRADESVFRQIDSIIGKNTYNASTNKDIFTITSILANSNKKNSLVNVFDKNIDSLDNSMLIKLRDITKEYENEKSSDSNDLKIIDKVVFTKPNNVIKREKFVPSNTEVTKRSEQGLKKSTK